MQKKIRLDSTKFTRDRTTGSDNQSLKSSVAMRFTSLIPPGELGGVVRTIHNG